MKLDAIEAVCLDLNTVRNDFIFIHVNSFGSSFRDAHELSEEYYKHLQDDIDSLLEMYGGLSDGRIAVPFNLNKSSGTYVRSSELSDAKDLFNAIKDLCTIVTDDLEKARATVSATGINGYISEIDGVLQYWEKQARYMARRYCV